MSVPHETLRVYLEKCRNALQEVMAAQDAAEKHVMDLLKQRSVVEGQIIAVEELMNPNNPRTVELPFVKDPERLQEMYDKRLSAREDERAEEIYQRRQERTYKREAMDTAEQIDHINRLEKDERAEKEDNLSEGDS
jgi:hypothetical protein